MRKSLSLLTLFAFLLAACSAPKLSNQPTPTSDAVATQVALMLTQMPTATTLPPSDTPAPTVTLEATAAPEVTDTPVPTETLAPTATLSGDPKAQLGEPSWQTSLESGKPFGIVESDNTRIRMENGALVLTGVNANGWLGWSLTFSQQPKDFYLEALMKTQDCAGSDQYGLMFRAPDTSAGYFFGVTCDGRYFLEANDFRDNGTEASLLELSATPHIQPGANQSNRLGVMARGTTLSLYANGSKIAEVTDTVFQEKGYFGAFVAAQKTAGFTVHMEEIALWNLP
jgi:hypothetical protein